MFGWLKKVFGKRGIGEDYYTPEERLIYCFWDGTDGHSWQKPNRRIDPLPLYRKILEKRLEIIADFKALEFPDQTQFADPARERLVKTVRQLFGIRPLIDDMDIPPEGSLRAAECLALLDDFLIFTERVKKNLPEFATRIKPSDPCSDVCPTTGNTTASG